MTQLEVREPSTAETIGIFCLEIWDALTGSAARDFYAGVAALAGLAIVAEMVLVMFGHPLLK
jgi:hypothetical protein